MLDDGSIQKGFAKVSSAAGDAAKNATKEFSKLGDVISTDIAGTLRGAVLNIPIAFAGIATAGVAAGVAIKKAFDFTLEGEQLNALDKQFENIAEGAGLIGADLRRGLDEASQGLVSTNDLLLKANSAIINLGASASRLPEVLDLARQASLALGGTVEQRFDALVSGIESANARALKSAGIILDVDKAYKQYATTLGLAAGDLTKAQQQQALLNAVLTEGQKKFKDVDQSVQPISDNLKRINVAIQDSREAFAQFVNSKFGEIFATITEKIADLLRTTNELRATSGLQQQARDAADLRVQILNTESTIVSLKNQIEELSQKKLTLNDFDAVSQLTRLRAELVEAENTLPKLKSQFDAVAVSVKSVGEAAKTASAGGGIASAFGITPEQLTLISQRQAQVLQSTIQADQALLQAKETSVNNILQVEERQAAQEELFAQQRYLLEQQTGNDIALLQLQLANDSAKTEEQKQALVLAAATKGQAQLIALDSKRAAFERQNQVQRLQTYSSIAGQIATLQQESSSELFAIGKAAAITQATIDGYLAVSNAFANVPYPFNFVAAGLVGAAAAANVARIAATGPGGGGATPNFDAGSAGGISAQPGETTNITEPSNIRSPQGTVIVNVDNVLGDESSGRKIVELINSAFDASGVNLRTGIV